jgi:hypothetical protein
MVFRGPARSAATGRSRRQTRRDPSDRLPELDSVIAVVNNQAILASDLDFEMRVFKLLPIGSRPRSEPARALERLTTRALIEQQILQEDPHGMDVSPRT